MGDHSIERTFICFFARAFAEIDLTSPAAKNPRIVLGILPFAAGRRRDVLGRDDDGEISQWNGIGWSSMQRHRINSKGKIPSKRIRKRILS